MDTCSNWRQLGSVVNGIIEQVRERRESSMRFEVMASRPAGNASRAMGRQRARINLAVAPMQLELPFGMARAKPVGQARLDILEVFS